MVSLSIAVGNFNGGCLGLKAYRVYGYVCFSMIIIQAVMWVITLTVVLYNLLHFNENTEHRREHFDQISIDRLVCICTLSATGFTMHPL